jgi:hypothetical protein
MKWDIFSHRRRDKKSKADDNIDKVIKVIGKFAPKKYRSERDLFYYNYKIMGLYRKPLLGLLETISHKSRFDSDKGAFVRELFLKLKDFYDPKDKLSLAEAIQDNELMKKFREIFLFFYEKKETAQDIEGWLKDI